LWLNDRVAKHWNILQYDGPHTRRIRKLVEGNPKQGDSAIRFAQYRTGMTLAEYVAACDGLSVPNYALFDVTFDSDPRRRLIELYD
jgi:hypothetical protein